MILACSVVFGGSLAAEAGGRAAKATQPVEAGADRECLARAMYFESRRTDEDGMLAVGTVVANRLATGGRYGRTICEVVGRRSQFAPGVLVRAMTERKPRERAYRMADVVLGGGRHPVAGDALYFHTADVPFRHDDKRYVLVSGGNAFYAWNRTGGRARITANLISLARAFAAAPAAREAAAPVAANAPIVVAAAESSTPQPDASVVERFAATAPAPAASTAQTTHAPIAAPDAGAILAYAEALPAPAAGSALAAVAALKPKRPRIVVPAAPVQAASVPVWPARSGAASRASAWSPGAIANAAVEKAWGLFDAVRR